MRRQGPSKTAKLDIRFSNWPESKKVKPLSEHSAIIVDCFIASLVPSSRSRVAGLVVNGPSIKLYRRTFAALINAPLGVRLNDNGMKLTESLLAQILADGGLRDQLRCIVDAATGNDGRDARLEIRQLESAIFWEYCRLED